MQQLITAILPRYLTSDVFVFFFLGVQNKHDNINL